MKQFDLAVIGGGPGGYVAAIRAAKFGLSVALIEANKLGGTCLNRGCIPSKTFLKHAEMIEQLKNADHLAINVPDYSFSLSKMVERKNQIVKQLNNGINGLLRQNKITLFNGLGYVSEDKQIKVRSNSGDEIIKAKNVILANGSQPVVPPIDGIDEIEIHTSDTIFDVTEIPNHMVVVGGGVIGLEIASVFNSLGTKVEIVEMAERILPFEDKEAAIFLEKQLTNRGITFHNRAKVTKFEKSTNENKKVVAIDKNGETIKLVTDLVLVSVGRKPNTTGLEDLNLVYDGPFVKVNKNFETSISNIFAIGDLIGGYQLAHAASNEGLRAINYIVGKENKKQAHIPRCVYTFPEIASVGMNEADAKRMGYKVKVKKIDLAANGKAITANENSGFMKIIAEEKYGEILGVVMIGSHVTEMISQATAFMQLEGTVEEMENMVFPHPTVSEGIFEAASAWLGKGIHYI